MSPSRAPHRLAAIGAGVLALFVVSLIPPPIDEAAAWPAVTRCSVVMPEDLDRGGDAPR